MIRKAITIRTSVHGPSETFSLTIPQFEDPLDLEGSVNADRVVEIVNQYVRRLVSRRFLRGLKEGKQPIDAKKFANQLSLTTLSTYREKE